MLISSIHLPGAAGGSGATSAGTLRPPVGPLESGALGAKVDRPRPAAKKSRVSTVGIDQETGRLVRITAGASKARTSATTRKAISAAKAAAAKTPEVEPAQIRQLVDSTARKHGVDPKLVHSVIRAESNYEQKAISPKGALGLMQLIPATASRFGVENPFDASQNLDGGVRYLKFLTARYQGNLPLALAAYNAGEGAVQKHGGVPPYRETREYVTKITRHLEAGTPVDNSAASERIKAVTAQAGTTENQAPGLDARNVEPAIAPRQTAVRMYTDSEGRLHLESIQ